VDSVDAVVVGAGAIGLACARELALGGLETVCLEATEGIGNGTSSRNSEVIHAGLHDAPGSLKATLCVAGRRALYPYCESHGVGHRRCGKLVVATSTAQVATLRAIEERALANDVEGLRWLDGDEARSLEPAVSAEAALLSSATGIVDSHALMLALQGDAETHGAQCVFRTRFHAGRILPSGEFALGFEGDEPMELTARCVINATGLSAPDTARRLAGQPAEHIPQAWLCKGNYFSLAGTSPFTRLIYPMPDQAGHGVHLTLDQAGQARFGPDTEWVDTEDYAVDPRRADAFYAAIRRYWPGLKDNALQPAYAGIRPKITGPGTPAADFMIAGPARHGVPGLLNLFGMESPGLTACLAIARAGAAALNGAS
jgi:L-2-hydroxyglutarate oxidase LhgO